MMAVAEDKTRHALANKQKYVPHHLQDVLSVINSDCVYKIPLYTQLMVLLFRK